MRFTGLVAVDLPEFYFVLLIPTLRIERLVKKLVEGSHFLEKLFVEPEPQAKAFEAPKVKALAMQQMFALLFDPVKLIALA